MLDLAGVFPPIPTPFHQDLAPNLEALHDHIGRLNQSGVAGVVVGGSNGEFVLLSLDERQAVVQGARAAVTQGKLLIAGSGSESTQVTIDLSLQMKQAGADALLVVSPSYYTGQMTAAALSSHYRRVADEVNHPILLYNVPANTGINIPIEAVEQLAEHPMIIGIKDSGGDIVRLASLVKRTPADFQVLAGSASFFLAALNVGAVGCISALANLVPEKLIRMLQLRAEGDAEAAKEIQLAILEANAAVTAMYGVSGLKAALELMGHYGGPVRPPLLPLDENGLARLTKILQTAGMV